MTYREKDIRHIGVVLQRIEKVLPQVEWLLESMDMDKFNSVHSCSREGRLRADIEDHFDQIVFEMKMLKGSVNRLKTIVEEGA